MRGSLPSLFGGESRRSCSPPRQLALHAALLSAPLVPHHRASTAPSRLFSTIAHWAM
jgi:hypothetical protein